MDWLRETSISQVVEFPGWMDMSYGLSSPKWPMRVGGNVKLYDFLCFFFLTSCFSKWCLLLVWVSWFGFLGIPLWTSKTVGWLLIHNKKPSLNIFGMVQLPTKYFNIQLRRGEGFKSATICWRKKPTQETDRKTHWDKPLTKRNLDFFFDKMAIPMFLIYWRWCWHHTKYALKTVGQQFLLAVMLFYPEKWKKPPRRLEDRYKLLGIKHFATRMLGGKHWKEWNFSHVFLLKNIMNWISPRIQSGQMKL